MNTFVLLFLSSFCLLFSAALMLLTIFWKPVSAKAWHLLVWAAAFLGAGFGLVENALWVNGENLFSIVFAPNFPLVSFFAVWFLFIAWLLERQGKRKVWVALLAALVVLVAIAVNCMNCLRL